MINGSSPSPSTSSPRAAKGNVPFSRAGSATDRTRIIDLTKLQPAHLPACAGWIVLGRFYDDPLRLVVAVCPHRSFQQRPFTP